MSARSSAWARDELRLSFSDHSSRSLLSQDTTPHGLDQSLRTTRLPRVTAGGGSLAKAADGSRVAVAGRDSLRILKLSTPDDAGVPKFESSRNYWDNTGGKAESANTDVVWARGLYSSKLLTGARNGELRLWDLQKNGSSKLETSARSHLRAIHKLALSTHLPHYCITGSADGDMRAWDLRDLHRSVLRLPFSTAVRAAVFSPDNTHALQIALGLDDGSLLRWDLRMGARGSLDRLPVAHVGPVMSLDWVPATGAPASPSPASSTIESDGITGDAMSRDGVGWIASAGLDKTIKIWSANSAGVLPPQPFYVLASIYPVRRVQFRPGHATEIASVSNTDQTSIVDNSSTSITPPELHPCAGEIVHIWDVRRENIPMWAIPTNVCDGGVSDAVWGDSRVLWAQHASGAFAQLDVSNMPAPLNSAVRSTVAWGASGALAFALDVPNDRELPFDDRGDLTLGDLPPKTLGEPPYRPITQSIGAVLLDEEDADEQDAFVACAKGYRIHGYASPKEACVHNAKVAEDAQKWQAAEAWSFAASLLEDIVPPLPAQAPSLPHLLMHSTSAPSTVPIPSPTSSKPPVRRSTTEATTRQPPLSTQSAAKRILSTYNPPSRRSSPGLTPSPNGSPSPLRKSINLPTVPLLEPLTFSRPGSASSTPVRERPPLFRYPTEFDPNARRPSLTPSMLSSVSFGSPGSVDRPNSSTLKHRVGEGALDSSSDEEDGAAEAGDEHDDDDDDDDDPSTPARTPLRSKPNAFSYLSRHSRTSRNDGSSSDEVAPLPSSFQRKSSLRRKKGRRESFGENTFLGIPASRLAHQVSTSSINTVIAVSGRGDHADNRTASSRSRSVNVSMGPRGDEASDADGSAVDDAFMHFTRTWQEVIAAEDRKLREMGWSSLKEDLECLAEEGDVQTCAVLSVICQSDLNLSPTRVVYLVQAYMDMLLRLELFTSAAYLRRHSQVEELRIASSVNTTIYTACGRCKKPILSPAPHVNRTDGKPDGSFSYCIKCQRFMPCSICRLPVRGLAISCGVCGHGGHWACYRRLRAERPACDKTYPAHDRSAAALRSPSRSRANSDLVGPGIPNLERLTTIEQKKEQDNGSKLSDTDTTTLKGHPCAAGCGHWCMLRAQKGT